MKAKKILILMMILVTLLSVVPANAAEARIPAATPTLHFVGTTAHCTGECTADTMQDDVIVRLVLHEDGTYVAQWRAEGKGFAEIAETYPATSGSTYKLTMYYTVNGITVPAVVVSGTCP